MVSIASKLQEVEKNLVQLRAEDQKLREQKRDLDDRITAAENKRAALTLSSNVTGTNTVLLIKIDREQVQFQSPNESAPKLSIHSAEMEMSLRSALFQILREFADK